MSDERATAADDDFADFIKKHGDSVANYHDLGAIVDVVYDFAKAQKAWIAELEGRITELESPRALHGERIRGLESKPSIKYCGTWEQGRSYAPGDALTHNGSLWICLAPTTGKPGTDFANWQLAIKRGKDAR